MHRSLRDPGNSGTQHEKDSSRINRAKVTRLKALARLSIVGAVVVFLLVTGLFLVERRHGASSSGGSNSFRNSAEPVSKGSSVVSKQSSTTAKSFSRPSDLDHSHTSSTPTTYQIGETSYTFVDRSRTVTIDGEVEPLTLPTRVLYPEVTIRGTLQPAKGPFPLIVFAPGYLQCRSSYAPLLDHWTAAGYVVAAIQFPLTNCHVVGKPEEWEVINQPADIAFVISSLLARSNSSSSRIASLIDPSEIGIAGHSDGGDTVAAVAANTCCRDELVKAAVVMAGSELASYPGRYFSGKTPPILFIQGSADRVNDPQDSLEMYEEDNQGPKWYLDLLGAGHFLPYEGDDPPEPLVAAVSTDFFDLYLKGDSAAAAQMYHLGNEAGVAQLFSASEVGSSDEYGEPEQSTEQAQR